MVSRGERCSREEQKKKREKAFPEIFPPDALEPENPLKPQKQCKREGHRSKKHERTEKPQKRAGRNGNAYAEAGAGPEGRPFIGPVIRFIIDVGAERPLVVEQSAASARTASPGERVSLRFSPEDLRLFGNTSPEAAPMKKEATP